MDRRVLRDRYELIATLGGGSGSTTYLALDSESAARCVVKELSVGEVVRGHRGAHSFDSDDFTKLIELFEREARVLAHLDHAGIPRFIDHFTESTDDTRLYTVQEYVEGETLEALVASGRHFTEDEAIDLCRQVTEILGYLHGHSPPLIHRDIKPSNVILAADGTAHVVDFGSVRNVVGGDDLDGRTIVGTYGYMPIEQYEARALSLRWICTVTSGIGHGDGPWVAALLSQLSLSLLSNRWKSSRLRVSGKSSARRSTSDSSRSATAPIHESRSRSCEAPGDGPCTSTRTTTRIFSTTAPQRSTREAAWCSLPRSRSRSRS